MAFFNMILSILSVNHILNLQLLTTMIVQDDSILQKKCSSIYLFIEYNRVHIKIQMGFRESKTPCSSMPCRYYALKCTYACFHTWFLKLSKCNGVYPKGLPQTSVISNIFSQGPLPLYLEERKTESVPQSTSIQQKVCKYYRIQTCHI